MASTDIMPDGKDKSFDSKTSVLLVPIEFLFRDHDIGLKLVPLCSDCRTPAIKSTNEVYYNPEYWTVEKIEQEHCKFVNLATTFGKTYVKDEGNRDLYLNGLDIDSDKVLGILFDLLEELKYKTFVTKTKKDCGYHVYWLSHKQNPPINTSRCRPGYEFEIKTDNSLGLCTLPPSRHRDAPNFIYHCVGKEDKIVIDDTLYERILDLLGMKCLVQSNPSGDYNDNGKATKSDLNSIYRILQDDKIEQIVSEIKESYQKSSRHDLVFGLSGLLFKNKISLPSAKRLICLLCDFTHDEDKNSRLDILSDTYLKGLDGQKIKGATQLQEVLLRIHGSTEIANEILGKVSRALIAVDSPNIGDNDTHPSATQILVRLARQNAVLFFKDQYGVAYGRIKVSGHIETLAPESTKFEYYLSKLYYDFTGGEIVGQESLSNAKRLLIAETLFEGPTGELNLRVAWGEKKGGEIYYDLADPEWQCIRISNESWQIVKSDSSAVLFTRFNQKPQVLPDRNYPDRIFDDFLDLMHVQEPGHRLLTKVWIVSLLIPEFPHPISITYGEKGGSKSTFCRFVKRLVDPDRIELLTTPQEKTEFVQQLHHNYLAIYDNIKHLPPWFSDEVCKAITGVGSSKRRLYSDDEDVIYDYKRCIMISGINNSLTEPDALDRSILTQFDRIPDEQRKEESEIEAEFEKMRPKLFGYILDMLVKTLQIKPSIKLSNLPRMADFAVWGEAIARAMGYQPMEFVNAYYDNIGKQNVEAIESNPLAQTIEKFVYSWYKEGEEACWQSPTSKALERLNKVAQAYSIDTSSKLWPKAANSLTKRLRPILSNLREGLGIHIVISRNTAGKNKNTSTIRVWKEPPLPPPSPPEQNHAQNENEIGGGSLDGGDTTSTSQQVSPPENIEIYAQKSESGGSGDSGGSIATLGGEQLLQPSPLSTTYVAFDFEWSTSPANTNTQIIAAAFVDSQGNSKALHLSDFSNSENPEHKLLLAINQELIKYDFSTGWYSTGVAKYHEDTQEYLDGVDSDLAILYNRCVANGVDFIVDFNNTGIPYIRGQKHIDLYSVFGKPMVQTTIFKNAYRTLKLNEVSKAVLEDTGEFVGKYKGLTGEDIQTLSAEEQKRYVLRDAELVMQLSKHNNGEVLDAMKSISELTDLDFEKVCRTGISTWWAAVFDNMMSSRECEVPALSSSNRWKQEPTELAYTGGIVLQPRKGLYHNLIVVDVASLYPTIAVLHNISFDTINCQCCRDISESKIGQDVTKDCKVEKEYWICRKKEGAFPKKLRIFKEERLNQKKLGNNVKQLALKILINGGYGVFGNQYFKYYDPRVAELITAYGRYTLSKMQEIATNIGFEIAYGDTDSLFLRYVDTVNAAEAISKFQEECNKQLGIEVEHAKTYQTAIISDKKKHYVGWTGIEGAEPDIVGMEGDKNDRPKWINTVFRQIVYDILANNNPIVNLKKAVSDLEAGTINPELLKRSNKLSKNPEEYENENDRKRKIGLAIGARKGDVIEYFESDIKECYSLNPQEISIRKYKAILWKAVKDILEIAGLNVAAIEQELILNSKDDTWQSLLVAWLDMCTSQFAKSGL